MPTGALVTQGGGIYVHSNVRNLHVTDNVIRGNSGSYGGAIRVGTPYVGDNRNYGLCIAHNQIRDNGGTNLAGGIGLFTGSDGYPVDQQRHLRQLLRGVRRRASAPSATRCTTASGSSGGKITQQPDLVQPVLRRGRRRS